MRTVYESSLPAAFQVEVVKGGVSEIEGECTGLESGEDCFAISLHAPKADPPAVGRPLFNQASRFGKMPFRHISLSSKPGTHTIVRDPADLRPRTNHSGLSLGEPFPRLNLGRGRKEDGLEEEKTPSPDEGMGTATPRSTRWHWLEPVLYALLALVLNLAGNARTGLWDRDEPRYAVCVREMRARGDWIFPTFNGEPRYHKPVLIYWLMGLGTALGGDNPFGARLVSSLAGAVTVLGVTVLGRRMLGPRRRIGWVDPCHGTDRGR